jgi:hypothetical protein
MRKLTFVLVCLLARGSNAIAAPEVQVITYPDEGVTLGTGWDTARNKKTNSNCVKADVISDTGEDKLLTFKRIIDSDSLMRSLSVSAEGKASSIVGSSVTASASFSKSVTLNSEDINISANAIVVRGTEYLIPTGTKDQFRDAKTARVEALDVIPTIVRSVSGGEIALTPDKQDLATNNKAQFLTDCGDGYVAAVIKGGSIEAAYAFSSKEAKEREDFATAMSGSFPGGSLAGSVKSVLDHYAKSTQLKIVYHQLGGSGDKLPITQQELETKIQNLAADTAKAPRSLRIIVVPYSDLPNYPIPADDRFSDLDHITSMYYQLASLRSQIDKILLAPDQYTVDVPILEVSNVQDAIAVDLLKLYEATKACLENTQTELLQPTTNIAATFQLPGALLKPTLN